MATVASAQLRQSLKLLHATSLVVGIIIGAAIFVQPAEMLREVPSASGIFVVWLVAGLLTLAGALICAELASAFPQTGGVYVFLHRGLSPLIAFLWGWAMFWTVHSGIIAAIAVVFGRYLSFFTPGGEAWAKPIAITVILVVSAINYLGVKHGGRLQAGFTIGKLAAIALIVVAGFLFAPSIAPAPAPDAAVDAGAFVRAVAAGLFAFGGWHMVTYTAGETTNAARTIPRALLLGVAIVVACYLAMNVVYLRVLPVSELINSSRVAADAADAVLGRGGAALMSGLVAFSSFGALTGLVLAGPRVYHAMAHDGLLMRWAGSVHARYQTPHHAIVLQAVWSCVLVATGTFRALFTRVIYTEWIFFALMTMGLLLLRRRPGYTPAYRVSGGAIVPMLFIVASFVVAIVQMLAQPLDSFIGLLLVLSGVPVYMFWMRARERKDGRADH